MDDAAAFLAGLSGGVAALAAGIRLVRRLPRRRRSSYGDLLPWDGFLDDGIVTRDGALVGVLRLHGPDLACVEDDDLASVRRLVESLLAGLPSDVRLGFELLHARSEQGFPRRGDLPEPLARLDGERTGRLRSGFRRAQYLSCRLEPRAADLGALTRAWARRLEEAEVHLDALRPRRLAKAELFNYANAAALVPWQVPGGGDVPVEYAPVAQCEHRGGVLRLGDQHAAVVSLRSLPESLFQECVPLDLAVNARFSATFHLPEIEALELELRQLRRRWGRQRYSLLQVALRQLGVGPEPVESPHVRRVAETLAGYEARLRAGERDLGKSCCTLVLWDEDPALLEEETRYVLSTLRTRGFHVQRETLDLFERFLSSLPGARPSAELFATAADASRIFPLTDIRTGGRPSGGPLDGAAPLFLARRSATRSSYRFEFTNIHRGVGHTVVLGPTGSGKSTLLSFLAAQWLTRYEGSRAVTIDVGRSAVGPVERVGGAVYGVSGERFAINLLRGAGEGEGFHVALEWLVRLASVAAGEKAGPREREILADALRALEGEAPERRRLVRYVDLVQDAEISRNLVGYCSSGPLGNMLDAETSTPIEDELWTLFEMEALLRLEDRWSIPVLDALLMSLSRAFAAKRPVILVMDEVWRLLRHPVFAETVKDYLLTLRKLNVSVVLATQNTLDFDPSILKSLVQQCSTRIFLADRSATGPTRSMYHELGLSGSECETIAAARPRRDVYVASEGGKALIHLDLSPAELAFLTETP